MNYAKKVSQKGGNYSRRLFRRDLSAGSLTLRVSIYTRGFRVAVRHQDGQIFAVHS